MIKCRKCEREVEYVNEYGYCENCEKEAMDDFATMIINSPFNPMEDFRCF